MMPHTNDAGDFVRSNGRIVRPKMWSSPDRHILLGVSHASDNPARHRVFEVRTFYDDDRGGWVAQAGEQNLNGQRGAWSTVLVSADLSGSFATPAACLGHAVTVIVAAFDGDAATSS